MTPPDAAPPDPRRARSARRGAGPRPRGRRTPAARTGRRRRPRPGRRRGGHEHDRPRLCRPAGLGRGRRWRSIGTDLVVTARGRGAGVRSHGRCRTRTCRVPALVRGPGGMGIRLMRLATDAPSLSTPRWRRQHTDHDALPRPPARGGSIDGAADDRRAGRRPRYRSPILALDGELDAASFEGVIDTVRGHLRRRRPHPRCWT